MNPLRTELKKRLIAENRWSPYLSYREFLKKRAVSDKLAWKVAAYLFPPLDGSPPEFNVESDPQYAEIVANHKNGKYPDPPPFKKLKGGVLTDFRNFEEPIPEAAQIIEDVKAAPKKYESSWEAIAEQVEGRNADVLEVIQWVFDAAGLPLEKIDINTVPSSGALNLLKSCREGGFQEFLRNGWYKLVPDKRQLEYQSRFKDDGRQNFDLLDDFERSLDELDDADIDAELLEEDAA